MTRNRRQFLKTVGAGTSGLVALGSVGAGMASAADPCPPTPVDAATANSINDPREHNFTPDDWHCARVRVYLTNKHHEAGLRHTLLSVETMLENLVDATNHLDGFLVRGFTTNVEPFSNACSGRSEYRAADAYVEQFGHEQYGGANLWLDDDGGTLGVAPGNHPCGPRPYERAADADQWNTLANHEFPHSFKEPVTTYDPDAGMDVTWAACHELMHQFTTPDRVWTGSYGTGGFTGERSHALADTDGTSVTVHSIPGGAAVTYGQCSPDPTTPSPSYKSLRISDCAAGAVDQTIEYVRRHYDAPPNPPTNLRLTGATTTSVDLAWDEAAERAGAGIDRYRILIANTGRSGFETVTVPGGTTTVTVGGLQSGTSYYASVSATDEHNNTSDSSETVTVSTAGGSSGSGVRWRSR